MLTQKGFELLANVAVPAGARTAIKIFAIYDLREFTLVYQSKVMPEDQPRASRVLAALVKCELLERGRRIEHGATFYRINPLYSLRGDDLRSEEARYEERKSLAPLEM